MHYKVIALQATMAAQVEGDTIHHALHIRKGGSFSKGGAGTSDGLQRLAKEMVLWKWLIIDEISMVSARLLSEIDSRLRCAARSIGTMKRDAECSKWRFGGLIVIFSGDF